MGSGSSWTWDLKRKDADALHVTLYQYQKVEYADVGMLQAGFLPHKAARTHQTSDASPSSRRPSSTRRGSRSRRRSTRM